MIGEEVTVRAGYRACDEFMDLFKFTDCFRMLLLLRTYRTTTRGVMLLAIETVFYRLHLIRDVLRHGPGIGRKTAFDTSLRLVPVRLGNVLVLFAHVGKVWCCVGRVTDGHSNAYLKRVSNWRTTLSEIDVTLRTRVSKAVLELSVISSSKVILPGSKSNRRVEPPNQ